MMILSKWKPPQPHCMLPIRSTGHQQGSKITSQLRTSLAVRYQTSVGSKSDILATFYEQALWGTKW